MSILSSLLGNDAARASNAAAADTYGKQQSAISSLLGYGDTLPAQYAALGKAYDPYVSAGTDALGMIRSGLGLPGGTGDFTAAYRALPGYQAALDAGNRAVATKYNAGGMGQSGSAMKGLTRYAQDYEDQKSGDYLTRLMGLSGQGLQATGAQTGLEAQGLGAQSGIRQTAFGGQMNSAGTIGQGMVAGAQAKQSALQNLLSTGAMLVGTAMGAPPVGMSSRLQTPTAAGQGSASTWWPAPRAA